ncbi:MAG: 2-C-methyl-D-erythritol 4-phosphate cytidylyltransferase [Syntrophales bacterium]|nr:2-C-methyl-D-erythritol 4-phosphate cytidylyltransferase [Syntrophales bacterium]
MLLERIGVPVRMVPGSADNIKITTPEDLRFAEAFLQRREKRQG